MSREYNKTCERKRRHQTKESALAHAQELIGLDIKNSVKPRRWDAYRCPFCGNWHVGNRGRGGKAVQARKAKKQ